MAGLSLQEDNSRCRGVTQVMSRPRLSVAAPCNPPVYSRAVANATKTGSTSAVCKVGHCRMEAHLYGMCALFHGWQNTATYM